jgi:hypothetical protein
MTLDSVHLNDQNDIISSTFAYKCQFMGSLALFPAMPVWQANAEAKCK